MAHHLFHVPSSAPAGLSGLLHTAAHDSKGRKRTSPSVQVLLKSVSITSVTLA